MSPLAVWTLRGAAAVFAILAVASLISPSATLGPHGLDLSRAPQAAFAELRAYYFGTWGVLAATAWTCAHGGKADIERGLMTVGGLVALFALARVYAFAVDGLPLDSPSASVAVATFAVETTSAAGCYFLLQRERQPTQARRRQPSPAAKLEAMEKIGPMALGAGMLLATAAALAVTTSASAPPPSPAPWWPKMGLAGA